MIEKDKVINAAIRVLSHDDMESALVVTVRETSDEKYELRVYRAGDWVGYDLDDLFMRLADSCLDELEEEEFEGLH